MNPEPVILRGVSGEPTTVEGGAIEEMEGTGFKFGGGIGGGVVAPPQPVISLRPRRKSSSRILVLDFRFIAALHEIKASSLSNLSMYTDGPVLAPGSRWCPPQLRDLIIWK